MGVSAAKVTIECPNDQKKCTICSTGDDRQNKEGILINNIICYMERRSGNKYGRHDDIKRQNSTKYFCEVHSESHVSAFLHCNGGQSRSFKP